MKFRQIFDAYSSQSNLADRSDVINQQKVLDGATSFQLNEFIDSLRGITSSPDTDVSDNEMTADISADTAPVQTEEHNEDTLDESILDALSDLDTLDILEDDNTTIPLSNDFDDESDLDNLDDDSNIPDIEFTDNEEPLSFDESTDFEDEFADILNEVTDQDEDITPDDNVNDFNEDLDELIDLDTEDTLDMPLDQDDDIEIDFDDMAATVTEDLANDEILNQENTDSEELDDLGDLSFDEDSDLDSIFGDGSDEDVSDSDIMDFDDLPMFEDDFEDQDPNDFDFEIENPDELNFDADDSPTETPTSSSLDDILGDGAELPDFSSTEYNPLGDDGFPLDTKEFQPTDYEQVEHEANFDIWNEQKQSSTTDDLTQLNFNEQQIFTIRERINDIEDKELRFTLRNIILDANSHKEYFEPLMSMILLNVPEAKIREFLESHIDHSQDIDPNIAQMTEEPRSSFLADDVIRFEEFKASFFAQFKLISFAGIVILLLASIAWFGVAQPVRVTGLFEKGLQAITEDRIVDGESLFNQATQIAGKPLPEWYVRYGQAYAQKGLNQVAEQKFVSALAIAPKDIDIAISASDFYTNIGINEYPKALSIMQSVSRIHPKNFRAWDYYGSLYTTLGDLATNDINARKNYYFQAADVFTEFINKNPRVMAPYYNMIDLYIKLGNEEHIRQITRIVEQANPRYLNLEVLNKLANYYINQRDLDSTSRLFDSIVPFVDKYINNIPDLKRVLKKEYNIEPDIISNLLSDTYYEFARYNMLSFDKQRAISTLSNSILLNNNNARSYNLLGEVILSESSNPSRFYEAERIFKQALEIDSNFYKPHINLGHINYYWTDSTPTGSLENALYQYRTAKALIPANINNFLLNYNLGWLEFQNDNTQVALDLWSELYKNDPNNPTLNFAMGSVLYKAQNPQLSQVTLTKAAQTFTTLKDKITAINPDSVRHKEIFTQMAKIYNNIGVINANYALANRGRADYFNSQALLNFYESKNLADQISQIYNVTEYNIGVLTRPSVGNRPTIFDFSIPKQTTLENPIAEFNKQLLERV